MRGSLGKLPELHDQLATAADGAGKLSAGAGTAVSGSRELATGITKLADGSKTLADGAGQVADGTQKLVEAVDSAAAAFEKEVARAASLVREGAVAAGSTVEVLTLLADKAVADTSAVLTTVKELCAGNTSQVCRDAVKAATTAKRQAERISKDLHALQRLLARAATVPASLDALANCSSTERTPRSPLPTTSPRAPPRPPAWPTCSTTTSRRDAPGTPGRCAPDSSCWRGR
ncbi:hypothetical protein [Streptomyces sp. NPDC051183]|uniref:hypothetical protein n=1 Tax=Streptomyces sp. NPDC051183 TaxID=3155165 RepID=UPI00343DD662